MLGARNRWAVALRIARRSALTSWGRSLLIVVLIAAPITGLSAAAVLLPSTRSTLAERIQGTLGHAQARLTVIGGPEDHLRQGVEGGYDFTSDPDSADTSRVDPRTVLPASTRVLAIGSGAAVFRTPAGSTSLSVVTGPSWDPSLDGGPYVLRSGRRPTAADEVLLSPAALTRLGATVGGTIRMLEPTARTLTVVGTSQDRQTPSSTQTVFAAAAVLPADPDASADAFTWYVPSTPIDWAAVQRLNAAGITAFSRAVVTDPPAVPADAASSHGDPFLTPATAIVVGLALSFAVLEVALLAGAAFLVGARLQQRALATVASVGAERAVLRRIVTASGVVLGAVGGVIGVALGIGGALLVMRLTDDGTWTRYPGVHLVWPLLAGIAVFGVLVGWIASLVPARAASRFDVIRALRGARTPQRVGRRPVVGIVVLAAGLVCTALGAGALVAALKVSGEGALGAALGATALLGGGPVLAQLGVVLCSGLLLRGLSRLLARAPLPARLAARDTSRNLGRAVPAVASVMTTVFLAAFAMCIANTASLQAAVGYYWQAARTGDATSDIARSASGVPPTAASARAWEAAIDRTLPVARSTVVAFSQEDPDADQAEHPSNRTRDALPRVRFPDVPTCGERARHLLTDLRCGPFSANGGAGFNAQQDVTVGSAAALGMLLGHAPSAQAVAALESGGAVALRAGIVTDGAAHLDWYTPKQLTGVTPLEEQEPRRRTSVAAVLDPPEHPIDRSLYVTPATADRLGLVTAPSRVLMTFARPPTDTELDAANSALGALANSPGQDFVHVESGPQDLGSSIAWLVLLGCLIIAVAAGATAIGLARVDGRPDDLTLASLGSSPRIRRTVAAVQALIVCGLGAAVGTVLGLLPAVAIGGATQSFPFAPPVLQLVLVAIGIPAVIAAGSWLLVGTRRGDLTRRTSIA